MNTLDTLMAVAKGDRELMVSFLKSKHPGVNTASLSLDQLNDKVLRFFMDDTYGIITINSNDMNSLIHTAVENSCVKVLNCLLIAAATYGKVELMSLLLDEGADIDAEDNEGATPLHCSVGSRGSVEAAKLLLDRRADIEAKNNKGETPLHRAAFWEETEGVVELLLDSGADIEARNDNGETPLHYASLHTSCGIMASILLNRGANIEAKTNGGETPLHRAARNGIKDIVKELLNHGANVYALNNAGQNVLELARQIIEEQLRDVEEDEVDLDTIPLFLHYKELINLNKPIISRTLKEYVDQIIKDELNEPNNNLDGLKNILEAFSNKGDKVFCKNFLEKVKHEVESGDIIPKLDFNLSGETSVKKFLQAKSKLEDLKKLFSSIEPEQTDQHLKLLSRIATDAYKEVERSYNEVEKYIVDLENGVKDTANLLQTGDHRELLANDEAERSTKKLKGDGDTKNEACSEVPSVSGHLDVSLAGSLEESE